MLVSFVIFGLNNLVHILSKLKNDFVFFLRLTFLSKQINLQLVDLRLFLCQVFSKLIHFSHLLFKLFFQL